MIIMIFIIMFSLINAEGSAVKITVIPTIERPFNCKNYSRVYNHFFSTEGSAVIFTVMIISERCIDWLLFLEMKKFIILY